VKDIADIAHARDVSLPQRRLLEVRRALAALVNCGAQLRLAHRLMSIKSQ
jgi:hypothetical protein